MDASRRGSRYFATNFSDSESRFLLSLWSVAKAVMHAEQTDAISAINAMAMVAISNIVDLYIEFVCFLRILLK